MKRMGLILIGLALCGCGPSVRINLQDAELAAGAKVPGVQVIIVNPASVSTDAKGDFKLPLVGE